MSSEIEVEMSEAPDSRLNSRAELDNAINDTVGRAVTAITENFDKKFNERFQKLEKLLEDSRRSQPTTPAPSASEPLPSFEPSEPVEPVSLPSDITRPLSKVTVHPPKPFDGKAEYVEPFLRKMKQYLLLCRVPLTEQVELAATFLEGAPDKLWATESDVLSSLRAPGPIQWGDFNNFLQMHFGKLLPMSDYFREYEECAQRNSVTEYVARLKTCVNKLKGTYLAPAEGSVVMKFLRGLKPEVARFVNQNAPRGWWQEGDLDKVYAEALNFETNQTAMSRNLMMTDRAPAAQRLDSQFVDSGVKKPGQKRKREAKESGSDVAKSHNPDKSIRIPDKEFQRRLKAKRCVMCGKEKHGPCTKKDPTPF